MLFTSLVLLVFIRYAFGATFNITVGGPGVLQFDPPTVNAAVGDVVLFTFKQHNHTATESTFEAPCEMAPDGFDSGFIAVADDNTGPFPVGKYTVEDSDPVWVYCRQANHCQQGMVFAINPGDQFPAFLAAAKAGFTQPSSSSVVPTSPPPTSSSTQPVFIPSSSASAPPANLPTTPPVAQTLPSSISPPLPATTISVPGPRDHFVTVGGPNKFFFSPSNITAQVGDTITFQFQQKNHTVTQSSFADPCVPLTQTSASGQVGFDSGFMPVSDSTTSFPTFKVFVNDTTPMWAYCRQANHCGLGMVFSVNAIESGPSNFAAFQARAMQSAGSTASNSTSSTLHNASSKPTPFFDGAGTVFALFFAVISLLA